MVSRRVEVTDHPIGRMLGASPMTRPGVAVFVTPEIGHVSQLLPLISDLTRRGIETHVFTDGPFQADVERSAGTFVDLFGKYPIAAADDRSTPIGCRYVSFAGHYADEVIRDLERIQPSLIIYDTFSVIGHVVGRSLGIPYVNVCAGHNVDPAVFLRRLRDDPRVNVSEDCLRAVERLRQQFGLEDASPFSYVNGISPFLNLYSEPEAFLTEAERRPFEPIAFYGSLPSIEEIEEPRVDAAPLFPSGDHALRLYISFGTVAWRYWAAEAIGALSAISDAVATIPDACALISLGGADIGASAGELAKPNVSVESYVDQWKVLGEADMFLTHHGLNSTHEAIFNRVPMIAYPFFWDQPGLAEKCRELGLAIPLSDSPRGKVREEDVHRALAELTAKADSLQASLDRARGWELSVIAARESVLKRIIDLAPGLA